MTSAFVLAFDDIDKTRTAIVGGKAANLGELRRIDGARVPPGFCVTTDAFAHVVDDTPLVDELTSGASSDIEAIGAKIRKAIETVNIPDGLATEIRSALMRLGDKATYAVRSSATAEDSQEASFAGQHDSYLNVIGASAVLDNVKRCWASLFTDRAITYRQRNNIDHRSVRMAVVVQKMVTPSASGVMFTADPVTFNRKVVAVEATAGLGEALVSGLVNPDVFKVRDGSIIEKSATNTLTDAQVEQLAALGRRIEAHFGTPQDIEWCFDGDDFQIVQSRPITTLYPIPPANDDANHVYVSVGHGQMMTDAMKPLGLSFWQMTTPAPMAEAGGRLFVDVTPRLAVSSSRADLLDVFGKQDPLLRDALQTVLERDNFIPLSTDAPTPTPQAGMLPTLIDANPELVTELIGETETSIAACQRDIKNKSGQDLLDFITSDMQELRRLLHNPRGYQVFMTAIEASRWLNENLLTWLGEKNVADTLTLSVSNNVTSEMGLALLEVADIIRDNPDDTAAIEKFLNRYGMRCVGEIDITRPRWTEQPQTLMPLILAHVNNVKPGEAQRRFEEGKSEAAAKETEVLDRLRAMPDGEQKAAQTKQMIDRVRTFIGYREFPKYGMISRYFIYKQALLNEAERLVQAGVLSEPEDIYFLRFEELQDVLRDKRVDQQLIEKRKEDFHYYERLAPPRVLTSDGEAVTGTYRRDDAPIGALVGLAVSAGIIEGRARVIRNIGDAELEPGDILVTAFTDPSWTPLFVGIAGVVTEVGGMMTHGAVIAREYGLPAVVGVERATDKIADGQRIRVNGTDGYVLLSN